MGFPEENSCILPASRKGSGAGEMVLKLEVFAANPDSLSSIPRTYMVEGEN